LIEILSVEKQLASDLKTRHMIAHMAIKAAR